MATVLNVTEILKRSDGTEVKISGDSKFYAQNNYSNLILLDIEDGGSLEACSLINFTQQTRQSFTSHNFFMKPVGIVTRVVNDEVINAYQYAIQVPKLVLQNNTKGVIETDLTVTVSFGANYKGYFPNLTDLNISLPPTEQLQNDLSIAYVVELEQFLQVQYNSTTSVYEWVEVDYVDMFLTQKQYSLSSIYIQPGYSSPQGIAPISVSNTQVIMNILNDLEVFYNSLEEDFNSHISNLNNPHEVKANQVPFNNTGTQLISTITESAIKEINTNERNTNNTVNEILDGTETLREIRIGVEPNVAILRYIHTNGNNYQVVQIEYPDGRMEEINETIPVNYRNETGVTLNSGRVLMSDGTTQGGNPPRGLLFDPTSPNAYKLLGVTTLDGTQPNAKSKVTKLGIVHDVLIADLFASGTTYAEGQFLWGRVGGRLSNTPPTKPALQVIVGMIINLTGNTVDILINPIIFEKLADQSDVIVTALQNKDVVRYDDVAKVWKNSNGLTVAETDIANIKSGTQVVKKAEQDKNGNDIVDTYETKSDATSKLALKADKTYVNSQDQALKDLLNGNKLDKIWTDLTIKTTSILTDQFVLNRGNNVYKMTLATMLSNVVATEIFVVVQELPEIGQINKIYLVPSQDSEVQNAYEEFIWVFKEDIEDYVWERIGNVSIDLSNYYTIPQVDGLLDGKVDKVAGKGLSSNDYTNEDKQNVEKIPTIEQDVIDLENDKVDKVAGKQLSTEDFTTAEKTKLSGIATNAQVNVLEGVQLNGTDVAISSKKSNIVVNKTTVGLSNVANVDTTNPANITQSPTHRFVTDNEKSTWNGKQNALGFTAENVTNKVTTITASSTDTQYPTAKAVYDMIGNIESVLDLILGV